MSRRREYLEDGRTRWRTVEPVMGDAAEFRRTVDWRNKKQRRISYMSLVISPERGDLDLSDAEFKRLGEIWAVATNGKRHAVAGYVHRDSEHAHMHLFVPRDLYAKTELQRNHEATRAMLREFERSRDQEHHIDRIYEAEAERQAEQVQEPHHHDHRQQEEATMQHDRQREEEARQEAEREEEERQVEERRRAREERERAELEAEHEREM